MEIPIDDFIAKIDQEISEIEKNTNRGIKGLGLLLVELNKRYGRAKGNVKKLGTSYDIDHINKKDTKEIELAKKEGYKITDAELKRYADKELQEDYRKIGDEEYIKEYLEPIVRAYDNYVNDYKFDAKSLVQEEKFYQ